MLKSLLITGYCLWVGFTICHSLWWGNTRTHADPMTCKTRYPGTAAWYLIGKTSISPRTGASGTNAPSWRTGRGGGAPPNVVSIPYSPAQVGVRVGAAPGPGMPAPLGTVLGVMHPHQEPLLTHPKVSAWPTPYAGPCLNLMITPLLRALGKGLHSHQGY